MLVKVTQEDIDLGVRQECELCPIARAIGRAIGPSAAAVRIMVNEDHAAIGDEEWVLPYSAVKFVHHFDEERAVEPFVFELTEKPVTGD